MIDAYGLSQRMTGTSSPNEDAWLVLRQGPQRLGALVVDGSGRAGQVAKQVSTQVLRFLERPWSDLRSLAAWRDLVRQLDQQMLDGPQATMAVVAVCQHSSAYTEAVTCVVGDSRVYSLGAEGLQLLEGRKLRLGSGQAEPVLTHLSLGPEHTLALLTDGCWTPLSLSRTTQLLAAPVDHLSDRPALLVEAAGFGRRQWGDDCTCVVVHTNNRLQSTIED